MKEEWYVRSADGKVYGPADLSSLVEWAKEGRIEPTGFVSCDRKEWKPAQLLPELEMTWVVESEPGKFFGPFNREVVIRLSASGAISNGANVYRRHDLAVDKDPEPIIVEKVVEKIVEVEPPARTAIIEPEVVSAVAGQPPPATFSGIFKGADRTRMAALEAAAQRELAAAKVKRNGFGELFSRRSS